MSSTNKDASRGGAEDQAPLLGQDQDQDQDHGSRDGDGDYPHPPPYEVPTGAGDGAAAFHGAVVGAPSGSGSSSTPALVSGSRSNLHRPSGTARPTMLYIFKPTYFVLGAEEQVTSIFGRHRQETIHFCRAAFSQMKPYPDERVQIEMTHDEPYPRSEVLGGATSQSHASREERERERWSRVADEVWPELAERPPRAMRITIVATEREKTQYCLTMTVLVILGIAVLWGVLAFLNR